MSRWKNPTTSDGHHLWNWIFIHPSECSPFPNGIHVHNFDICSIITPVIRLPLETVVGTRYTHEGTRLDLSINLGLLNAQQIHSQLGHSQWCLVEYRITVRKKSRVFMSFGLFKLKSLFIYIFLSTHYNLHYQRHSVFN